MNLERVLALWATKIIYLYCFSQMSQKVYVLINEAMPNLVKIWMTDQSLEQRISELSRASWVPLPFEVFYAAEVQDMRKVEKLLHIVFANTRINPKREFFAITPEQVAAAIKLTEYQKDITPTKDIVDSKEEQEALNIARKKAERFNFSMVQIPIWSILEFIDDPSITCIVIDNTKVEFRWSIESLSGSARIILNERWINYPVQWWLYRKFEWESLVARRLRYESWE